MKAVKIIQILMILLFSHSIFNRILKSSEGYNPVNEWLYSKILDDPIKIYEIGIGSYLGYNI